ncbi:COX15/CtaA family protein, partial [Flavobacteriaceae bacterium]|nr:COX15/CtaA family protein [Flavobacteriaceae bacterium]
NYVSYDPVHTWVEYINRLIGVLSGIPILIFSILSFWFWKKNKWIPIISMLTLFGMGFQAWLGKTVVDSNLAPYKITVHMLMALLIVAFILYLIFASKSSYKRQIYHNKFYKILVFAIILSLIQIVLGTQVREFVDEQTKLIGYQKTMWLDSPELNFYIHRSTSILVLFLNGYLWNLNHSNKLGYSKMKLVIYCVVLEVSTGIMMYYFDFPFLSQPLHLVIASILFGIQFYVLLECLHKKRQNQHA